MSKPVINFAHSNGFPGGVYTKLFRLLEDDYDVIYKDMYAHDPAYSVKNGWQELADELINFLTENASEPVIGVGHSFGASITFMAAIKRPELFLGIILIEPIMFIGPFKYLIMWSKLLGLVDRISPAGKTKNRRRSWPDIRSAESYFKDKSLFRNFDPECLQDYMKFGLEQRSDGYHLRFQVENEVDIFRNGPHHFDRYKDKLYGLPGIVISAEETDAVPVAMVRKFARQHNFDFKVIPGGHMFPLEQPEMTASLIHQSIDKIKASIP